MAEDGECLSYDEEETCEKNSESDEDSEKYVSAPIGEAVAVLLIHFCSSVCLTRVICTSVCYNRLFPGFSWWAVASLRQLVYYSMVSF